MRNYVLEALNYTEEGRHLAISAETVKLELLDAEKELTWMKSAVSSSEEYEQIQREMGRVMTELETERYFHFFSILDNLIGYVVFSANVQIVCKYCAVSAHLQEKKKMKTRVHCTQP